MRYGSIKNVISGVLNLIYPWVCPLCGKPIKRAPHSPICPECASDSEIFYRHTPTDISEILPDCAAFTCIFRYTGNVREAVLKYKFQGKLWMAMPFGNMLYSEIAKKEEFKACDVLAYVPVSSATLRKRGYDQTLEMLKYISRKMNKDIVCALSKKKGAADNARGHKNKTDRTGVSRYEPCGSARNISGKHVLLIDDVLTTGSTLRECTDILLSGGAASVSCAVLASGRRDI